MEQILVHSPFPFTSTIPHIKTFDDFSQSPGFSDLVWLTHTTALPGVRASKSSPPISHLFSMKHNNHSTITSGLKTSPEQTPSQRRGSQGARDEERMERGKDAM